MRPYRYLVVDVFTERPLEGNPLAVFPDAAGIDDDTMQRVARELNLSETVFVLAPTDPSTIARLRIFTPAQEVPFAGHPTIGTAYVLTELGRVPSDADAFVLSERIGPVRIRLERRADPFLAWLRTPPITFGPTFDGEACARALGLDGSALTHVSPQVVSAANPFLFIALREPRLVDAVAVDSSALERVVPPSVAMGFFVFAPTPTGAYSRMFAPRAGVTEDPATGSATGPLGAYLARYGFIPLREGQRFTNTQGVHMGRPSALHAILRVRDGTLETVEVGGSAVQLAVATMTLPSAIFPAHGSPDLRHAEVR